MLQHQGHELKITVTPPREFADGIVMVVILCNEYGVIPGQSLPANGNDAIAVMVVQEVTEEVFTDTEAGVIAL